MPEEEEAAAPRHSMLGNWTMENRDSCPDNHRDDNNDDNDDGHDNNDNLEDYSSIISSLKHYPQPTGIKCLING